MRLAEQESLKGIILVSAAHTDLGDDNERASEYFDTDWHWKAMVRNTRDFILQFHSDNDHLIPVEEARFVAESLHSAQATLREESAHHRNEDKEVGGKEEGGVGAEIEGHRKSSFCPRVTYRELKGFGHFFHPFKQLLTAIIEEDRRDKEERGKNVKKNAEDRQEKLKESDDEGEKEKARTVDEDDGTRTQQNLVG